MPIGTKENMVRLRWGGGAYISRAIIQNQLSLAWLELTNINKFRASSMLIHQLGGLKSIGCQLVCGYGIL